MTLIELKSKKIAPGIINSSERLIFDRNYLDANFLVYLLE